MGMVSLLLRRLWSVCAPNYPHQRCSFFSPCLHGMHVSQCGQSVWCWVLSGGASAHRAPILVSWHLAQQLMMNHVWSQVQAALEQAMHEAQKREQSMHEGLSFEQFLRMLRSNSSDSLDQYDDRMSGGGSSHGSSSYDQLDNMEKSLRCGDMYMKATSLDPIPEVF